MARRGLKVHKPKCPTVGPNNGNTALVDSTMPACNSPRFAEPNGHQPATEQEPLSLSLKMRCPTTEDQARAWDQEFSDPTSEWYGKNKESAGEGTGMDEQVDRRYLELSQQVLDLEGLRALPPPKPLVHDYLHQNSLAWIGGQPGHGKSFLAIEIACCVATGLPWHGHKVEQGKVLYLIAEGASGFPARVDAWAQENQTDPAGMRFLPVPVQMMDSNDIAAFKLLLADHNPVLIVLDTQARVTVGAEENSSKDMGRFVDTLGELRKTTGACILIVHHMPRNGDNLRGSTALEGAADTILKTDKDGELVTLSMSKQKDAPEMNDMELALESRGKSAVLMRKGMEHNKLTDTARKLLTLLADYGTEGASGSALQGEIRDAAAKATVKRTLKKLVDKGLVIKDESGRWPIYRLSEQGDIYCQQVVSQS